MQRLLPAAPKLPRLLGIYVVSKTGVAAGRVEVPGFSEDPAALGMMLGVVAGFVRDELSDAHSAAPAGLIRVASGTRGFCALPQGDFGLIAVFEGRETEAFVRGLQALARRIERHSGALLGAWDGNRAACAPIELALRQFLRSSNYPELAGLRTRPQSFAHAPESSAPRVHTGLRDPLVEEV